MMFHFIFVPYHDSALFILLYLLLRQSSFFIFKTQCHLSNSQNLFLTLSLYFFSLIYFHQKHHYYLTLCSYLLNYYFSSFLFYYLTIPSDVCLYEKTLNFFLSIFSNLLKTNLSHILSPHRHQHTFFFLLIQFSLLPIASSKIPLFNHHLLYLCCLSAFFQIIVIQNQYVQQPPIHRDRYQIKELEVYPSILVISQCLYQRKVL